ncbi:MAG: cyanophycinase [Candidatus Eremiobacteraeota bacterium]|nr:cyanophycinase [Candidatus Eremiobacteraeota bacterium]
MTVVNLIGVALAVLAVASVQPSTPPALTIFPRAGNPADSHSVPHGPGLVLMGGGGTVDPAFVWMHDVIAGGHDKRGGDVIVLRASGDNAYDDYLLKVAPFNSARSILIGKSATTADLERAASYVDRAQAVFFAGGDQANYARWKGSPLIAAVQRVYQRGGVIGGTSAGLAILGEYAYDSVAADAAGDDVEVTTANAVSDPSEPIISFTHKLLDLPPLRRIITDTHFVARNRFGRLAVFLSRIGQASPGRLMGVGLDERSAIVIDRHGIGTLMLEHHGGSALFIRPTRPDHIAPGTPFSVQDLSVTVLNQTGQHYDFNRWCAQAPTYSVSIDGARRPIYEPADPYHPLSGASSAHC